MPLGNNNLKSLKDGSLSSESCLKDEQTDSQIKINEYFSVTPDYGQLKPFEKLPFSLRLSPRWKTSKQGFVSLNESPSIKPFSVYLRIHKVDLGACDVYNKKEFLQHSAQSLINLDDRNNLAVVLTGCLIPVQLLISSITESIDIDSNNNLNKLNTSVNNGEVKVNKLYENQFIIQFPSCLVGSKICVQLKLSNQCKYLPIHFRIPRIAHFILKPDKGVIGPQKDCLITVCFSPKQIGEFHAVQNIHVLNHLTGENSVTIHQYKLILHGYSPPITIPADVRFNPGIVPKWAHEVGRNTDLVTFGSNYNCPRAAIISLMSMKSLKGLQSHVLRSELNTTTFTKVAFPNDRLASIRPMNKHDEFKTLFCRLPRYTYTDEAYEWRGDDLNNITKQQSIYTDVYRTHAQMIEQMHKDRILMKWNKSPNDGSVLMELDKLSPKLKIKNFEDTKPIENLDPMNLQKNAKNDNRKVEKKKVPERVLSLKQMTKRKVNDECKRKLSVKAINELSIFPVNIEYGNICPNVESTKYVTIINPLNQCISFKLNTILEELKPTIIRDYVIQPKSRNEIPITIEITKVCNFQCNLSFTLNDQHTSNLVICATVIPIQLVLTTSTIELTSANLSYGLIRTNGMRGYVTLFNPLHASAKFRWQSLGDHNSFTICPKKGIVEPFSSLNCEVVYYPCINTSMEGRFQLKLPDVIENQSNTPPTIINKSNDNNKIMELLCVAKLFPSKLSFSTRRLPLGSVAHGLPYTRQITIFNLGQNPVLFQINKESKSIVNHNYSIPSYMHRLSRALPAKVDMQITPIEGEIPIGGEITLKVTCIPIGLGKFESSMTLNTYDGQNINLSVCGTVLCPQVEIIPNNFEFGGVRIDSKKSLPFEIINNGITRALVEIQLRNYNEFQVSDSINSPSLDECMNEQIPTNDRSNSTRNKFTHSSYSEMLDNTSVINVPHSYSYLECDKLNNSYSIYVPSQSKWVGSLVYKPKEVSFHDFVLPLLINKLNPQLLCQKPDDTNGISINAEVQSINGNETDSKMPIHHYEPRVLATALRQPITIEPKSCILKFITNLDEKAIKSSNILHQHLSIKSLIDLPMKWHLAVHKIQRFNKRGHGKLTVHNVHGVELLPDLDGYINGDFSESDDKTIHLEIRLCTVSAGYCKLELPICLTFPKDSNCEESPKSNSTLYKTLQIHIELKKLELKFEPERILLPPIPTGVNARIPVTLTAYQLNQPIKIFGFWNFSPAFEVQSLVSEENIECPFSVEYPEGQILKPRSDSSKSDTESLNLFVNFNCKLNGLVLAPNPRPLCLIIIGSTNSLDSGDLCYSSNRSSSESGISSYICSAALPVSAAVDNCLISWFDYITRRPSEFKLTDYQHLRNNLQEMKSNGSINITSFYHWLGELKLLQNEHLNSEDTFSDQSFTVRSDIHQNSDEDCLNGTRNTQINIYETSQRTFIHREFSEHLEDSDEIKTSSSAISRTINSYRSSLFLPDWHLIDRAATEHVQRWLGVHGFPTGRYQFKFPDDFRNCISLTATLSDISIMGEKQKSFNKSQQNTTIKDSSQNSNREMNNKSNVDSNNNNNSNTNETVSRSLNPLYNCLLHLCGNKQPPGLFPSINLPIYNPYEALSVVYFYCSALLTFARSQGSCLPHILPEHLMEPNDYHLWHKCGCPGLTESARTVYASSSQNNSIVTVSDWTVTQKRRDGNQSNDNLIKIDLSPLSESEPSRFLLISERAWTDVLMQLIKCLLFNRITISSLDTVNLPPKDLLLYKTGEFMSGTSTLSKQFQSQNESNKSDQVITHTVHLSDQNGPTRRSTLLNFNEIQVISCYSPCERILLAWLNYCYHQYACQLWPEMKSAFPNNWMVTNFDNDLRDGIVLACTVGAYLPSLIPNLFSKVYAQPTSNEQRFHNAIIIVQALKIIRFEFDLCPSDITSPHPFGMVLLCLHLFCQLPDYLPKQTINFTGVLNSTTKRQLLLTNTSSHMLTYYCVIIGPNANDFSCSFNNSLYKNTERENNKINLTKLNNKQLNSSMNGNNISNNNESQLCNNAKEMKIVIPPKGKLKLYLEYKSRFLRLTEAVFLAVSQRQNTLQGKTLSFILSGTVGGLDNLPLKIVKSPCYQMTEFKIPIVNPYKFKGTFNITKIESCNDLFMALCQIQGMNIKKKESTSGNVLSMEAYSVTDSSPDQSSSDNSQLPPEIMKEYYQRNQYQSFHCRESAITLCGNTVENKTNSNLMKQSDNKVVNTKHKKQQQIIEREKHSTNELSVIYLPLNWGIRECCLLLSNEKIGEFVILLKGIAQLPQPSLLPFTNEFNIDKSSSEQKERGYRIKSAVAAASFGRSGDPNVIYFRCPIGCEIKETLRLPVKNDLRRTALLNAIHIRLSLSELKHRQLANTLESDELLELANKKLILPNLGENSSEKKLKFQKRLHISRYSIYSVEIDTDMIKVPSKVHVPIHTDLDTDDTFPLPLKIIADKPGLTSAKLVIQGPDDIRLYRIECVALPSNEKIILSFTSPLNHPITQPIPIVNKTAYDWELFSQFIGNPLWFTGPSTVNVASNTTVQYPITYLPRRETESHTKLLLRNITDGSQLEYHLNGIVLKPLSLGKINLEFKINVGDIDEEMCRISKQNHLQTFSLKIPNSTSVKQCFQLQTNLPKGLIEWVPNNQKCINRIEVMSGRTDECKFQVNVSRQGSYRGVIVFVADSQIDNSDSEIDEESMENHKNDAPKPLSDLDENSNQIYRLWYEVEINIKPGSPPIKQVEITCPCLSCKTIELPFKLQSESFKNIQTVEFDVAIDDKCLIGPKTHCVNSIDSSGELSTVYQLNCIPSIVGISNLAVVFYHPNCGEFWIELIVKALKPETVNMPTIEAELGSSKILKILLDNPTEEMYILKPKIFNSDVFKLQLSTSAKQLACLSPSLITESSEKHPSHLQTSTLCQSSNSDILNIIDELTNKSSSRLLTNRSNTSHSTEGIIRLKPKSKLYLGLKFTPSAIGDEEHHGSIVFYSDKLAEWCFNLHGNGIAPQPRDPITVSVMIGSATTVIVPIINPFKYDTVLDINLCETTLCGLFKHLEDTRNDIYKNQLDNKSINSASVDNEKFNDQLTKTNECNCDDNDNKPYCRSLQTDPTNISIYSAFQLLVKEKKNIRLSSKSVFDIPISFAPLEMREHEALCTVIMHKLDSSKCKSSRSTSSIRWLIPIKGIPEMKSLLYPSSNEFHLPYPYQSKKNAPLIINGTVRSKSCYVITLRLFNSLTHTINNSALSEQMKDIEIHNVQSDEDKKIFNEQMFHETSELLFNKSTLWERIQVGNLEWTLKPVIKKDDEQLAKLIEVDKIFARSLIMKLLQVKKHDDLEMTEINLGMIFSPSLSFKCSADLLIRTCLGAIWKFGLIFKSKDPPIDDIIYIPHQGIGRSVKVQLPLTSQTNEPMEFIARLYPENQIEYTVEPKEGILPPIDAGIEFKSKNSPIVITFKPTSYGKPIIAQLIIQIFGFSSSSRNKSKHCTLIGTNYIYIDLFTTQSEYLKTCITNGTISKEHLELIWITTTYFALHFTFI
ncbi:hypothetical protein MN116_001706 [Schistosoma mekongi]|uniref:Calponin-homology (CH) domain-containing protein n=1 Tax=Schistosoma mekongi TaxID=38744 RepID=A0AAE2D7P3_SCHME|nr:hypothetical protein MN116_001706 [Schistosoma mekongi]